MAQVPREQCDDHPARGGDDVLALSKDGRGAVGEHGVDGGQCVRGCGSRQVGLLSTHANLMGAAAEENRVRAGMIREAWP